MNVKNPSGNRTDGAAPRRQCLIPHRPGVAPLSQPLAAVLGNLPLRLRDDEVTEENRRDDYQLPAPKVQDGLYLVPQVIE